MSSKIALNKPLLIMLYGFPGAGKTYFARQLCENVQMATIQSDRIRYELFEQPRFDKQENTVVNHLMEYMAEEFLRAGVSVIYDGNAMRYSQRMALRDMTRKVHAEHLLIWIQIDPDSAYERVSKRDRRKSDDKYALPLDQQAFDYTSGHMQNPQNEDYVVISGKHTFNTQRSAVIKKLYEMNLVSIGNAAGQVVKPGLINLVPNVANGRVDISRRNIVIR